ncbi:hypothetical protein ScalyP_jg4238, partial [Parmales sp. scaly parma]
SSSSSSSSSSTTSSCLNAHATQTAWLTGILGKRNSKILLIIGGLAMIKKFLAKGKFIKGSSDGTDEPNWKYVTTDKKQEKELKAYSCNNCGYTLFPARGREGKFFPPGFTCPICRSGADAFEDVRDEYDTNEIEEDMPEFEDRADYAPKEAAEAAKQAAAEEYQESVDSFNTPTTLSTTVDTRDLDDLLS